MIINIDGEKNWEENRKKWNKEKDIKRHSRG